MRTEERLHSLDATRAFALLLGIVLHATMTFMPGLAAMGFPADSSQSSTLQIVFYVIHVFRMTLFFFIAGYFAHLAFQRKGAVGFVHDRFVRILVPLIVGWIFFGPIVLALIYAVFVPVSASTTPAPLPTAVPLAHLWFLYYLLILYATTLACRWCVICFFEPTYNVRKRADAVLRRSVESYWTPVLLAAPIALCLYSTPNWIMWTGIASPETGLSLQTPPMVGFGTAFVFGWLLRRQSDLLAVFRRRWSIHLVLAIVFTTLSLLIAEHVADPTSVEPLVKFTCAACYSLAMWNWVFGIVGAAQKFFSGENRVRRYLADASYWMYLAHLPIVFALQMIALEWPLHWTVKFPLIVAVTVGLLLLSYHFVVRDERIGTVLNGTRSAKQLCPAGTMQ